MSEIEEFEEQFTDLIDSIRQVLDKELSRLRGTERTEKCSYLKNRLNRAKQVHRSILVEIRDLPEKKVEEWEKKAKEFESVISKIAQDINWAETTAERDDVKKKNVDDMNTQEVQQQAMQLQEKTQESAANARMRLEETINIGTQVQVDLVKQGEQLAKIADDVDHVEDNLKRADVQLRAYLRRLATDKIFIVVLLLIVIAVIIAIVGAVLKSQNLLPGQKKA